jgi:hypothetical protein
MCGMIAGARSFWARTLSLGSKGPPGRSRVLANDNWDVWFGRRHAGDAQATGVVRCGVDVRPPSDWGISKKKPATDFSVRVMRSLRCCYLARDLPDGSSHFRNVNQLRRIRPNGFDKLKLLWLMMLQMQIPHRCFGAGYATSAMVSLCP